MRRKLVVIICVIVGIVLAAALFFAIWFGPKASLKRELNVSIPEDAEIVNYRVGFWVLGYELPAWKIKVSPEDYPAFKEELINGLKGLQTSYKYCDDVSDLETGADTFWLKELYEKSNGFQGFYDKDYEFQWSAFAARGREPLNVKSETNVYVVAALGDDGYYYISIVVM